jgi:hypothetical protein
MAWRCVVIDFLMTLTPVEVFMLVMLASLLFVPFTRPRCRHEWEPLHHSYRCIHCGKLDREH